jgi:hypothetical protein
MAPPDQAGQLYQDSIDILGRTTATADVARSHLLFGEWLRRSQRPADARGHLQTALGLFTSVGAVSFARPAAVGYANQEIADRLFITTHTVEYHLKKVFRKLGIISRRQLRDKVSGELS